MIFAQKKFRVDGVSLIAVGKKTLVILNKRSDYICGRFFVINSPYLFPENQLKMSGGLVWAVKNGDLDQVKQLVDTQVS